MESLILVALTSPKVEAHVLTLNSHAGARDKTWTSKRHVAWTNSFPLLDTHLHI